MISPNVNCIRRPRPWLRPSQTQWHFQSLAYQHESGHMFGSTPQIEAFIGSDPESDGGSASRSSPWSR